MDISMAFSPPPHLDLDKGSPPPKRTCPLRFKNVSFILDGSPNWGGGVKARAIKERRFFVGIFFSNVPMFIKLEGEKGV